MYNPYDFYFKQAKKEWYKARSAFKLDEIQQKFWIFDKSVQNVVDIWCAPWSWLQYAISQLQKNKIQNYKLVGFDLKEVDLNMLGLTTFVQDITDQPKVESILREEWMTKIDLIQSDMAPNTTGIKDLDAVRSIGLIQETLWIYKKLLRPDGKFVIKVFMWPWFDELVKELKDYFGGSSIRVFKPKSCRSESKETYIIKAK